MAYSSLCGALCPSVPQLQGVSDEAPASPSNAFLKHHLSTRVIKTH